MLAFPGYERATSVSEKRQPTLFMIDAIPHHDAKPIGSAYDELVIETANALALNLMEVKNMNATATIVTYTVGEDNAQQLLERVETMLVPAARQAQGYLGFLMFDQGEGRRLGVVLFDSPEHVKA